MDNFHIYENHLPAVAEYLKNVSENTNNIINQKAEINLSKNSFCINKKYISFTDKLNAILSGFDFDNYRMFTVVKDYNFEHEYPEIKAEVAI